MILHMDLVGWGWATFGNIIERRLSQKGFVAVEKPKAFYVSNWHLPVSLSLSLCLSIFPCLARPSTFLVAISSADDVIFFFFLLNPLPLKRTVVSQKRFYK